MNNIPFFNYQYFYQQYSSQLNKIFNDVLSRGAFILQRDLEEFEDKVCEYLNVKHAIGVANCTDGLQLAVLAAGIGPGDEVIFPSHTFVATAASIHYSGATPVPVDCGEDHTINIESIKQAISSRTKAIMPVQLNGRTAKMDSIMEISKQNNLIVIEDSAQALGSKYKGQSAGTFGLAGAFSFYPAKVLPCFGDGGMVVTNDDVMAEKLYALHEHGRNKEGQMTGWGMNSRLDNLQAAFLNFFINLYDDQIVSKRRHIASIYQDRLQGNPHIHLPPAPNSNAEHFDVFQNYEVEFDFRDELQQYLTDNGIGSLRQWNGKAVHQWQELGMNASLPYTDKMTNRYLLLPMNISLCDDDVNIICDKINHFYEHIIGSSHACKEEVV